MKRLFGVCMVGAVLAASVPALAQTTSQPQANTADTRPATTTVSGDTGLWFVPTAEVLPNKEWSVSFYRVNADFGQGFTDVSNFPLSIAVGIGNRFELFGSYTTVTRIDRDTRPLFFDSASGAPAGAGGGIVNEYPLVRDGWSGNSRGDLRVGGKLNLISQADNRSASFALRGIVKIATGDDAVGTSTGKTDFSIDGILSKQFQTVELSAFGGAIIRGNPDGFALSNGIRWGLGAGFPATAKLRFSAEVSGEKYLDSVITAPAGFTAADLSIAPTSTSLSNPLYAAIGLTYQADSGFFIGAGANWAGSLDARSAARCITSLTCNFGNTGGDSIGAQFRIGYHPGARKYVAPAPPPPPPPPTPEPAPRPNQPPTVRAACDPCTVEVGKVSTVSADAQDPDGDALTYRWSANTGSFTSATTRQTPWTAPNTVGAVPVTVTVTDSRGATARAEITIQVVQPTVREFVFEDVHFDFDRYSLRADALRILDEAITAMQADASLRLEIEGHTCNIGTAEYNLALGERRAAAVRDYLNSRGVNPDRLRVVSFGEERPKYDNAREETRRLNRRAALVVRVQ